MISDKQFEDSFTAAGGWFILTQFETVFHWSGSTPELIDLIFEQGFDKNRKRTSDRIANLRRIIRSDRGQEALLKIRDSSNINRVHPDAADRARDLLKKYYLSEE